MSYLLFKNLSWSCYLLFGLLRWFRCVTCGLGTQAPVTNTFEFAFTLAKQAQGNEWSVGIH